MLKANRSEIFSLTTAAKDPAWRNVGVIAAFAILAMSPELIVGLTITDNYRFNLLWSEQFADMFRAGRAYPRWLPHAWTGLGAPSFYFYPPAIFWVAGVVDAVTSGMLGPERFVPIATTIILSASGLAMRSWLLLHTSERRALTGALAYMLAPYHLYDIYCRGALAEAAAYASVPMVMLAIRRLSDGRVGGLPLLSVSYATLLLTHLPTALLVTILMIPTYVAWTSCNVERPARFCVLALSGGLLGVGLAALYLVPALTLIPFVNAGVLDQGFYRPESWFFWRMSISPVEGRQLYLLLLSIGAVLFAAATLHRSQRRGSDRTPCLWAGLTLAVVFLVAGFFPPFWDLPGLSLVQFPWRALLIVEFAMITALSTVRWKPSRPLLLGGVAVFALSYLFLGAMMRQTIGRTIHQQALTASELRSAYLDAPEYTPAGVRISNADDPTRVNVHLSEAPIATASDPRAVLKVREISDGGMTIATETPTATTFKVRRHYFPHWRVRGADGREIEVRPDGREGIVTFVAPAGKSLLQLAHGMAPNEVLGRSISLLALLLAACVSTVARRNRKGANRGSPAPLPPRPPAPG